tara:strand:- start:144 stop:641 length:498 start_codon:yes stop_codon:yes gene_type:complete
MAKIKYEGKVDPILAKDKRLNPLQQDISKLREMVKQQKIDDAFDEAKRKLNLRIARKEESRRRIEKNRKQPPVGKKLSELVKKAKVSKELDSLKKIKEAQLKTKPKSLLNKRKALIQATNLKNPTETNVKKILIKYGLRTVPIVGSLLSAFKSKPAGVGSSLDGR